MNFGKAIETIKKEKLKSYNLKIQKLKNSKAASTVYKKELWSGREDIWKYPVRTRKKNEEEYRKPTGIMGPNEPPPTKKPHHQYSSPPSIRDMFHDSSSRCLNPIHYTYDKV